MLVRWPGVVPAGLAVETTTQAIDLMPTLLELAQVPVPEGAQGRSLLPLLAAPEEPGTFGWKRAPAFTERRNAPAEDDEWAPDAYAVVHDGWKLVWNVTRRDERPEHELFDHREDPLNLVNVAEEHPEKVAELQTLIEGWRAEAEAARVSDEGLAEDLSPEELQQLKALGYVN
jgi:arylsulfatase A-like enzyme